MDEWLPEPLAEGSLEPPRRHPPTAVGVATPPPPRGPRRSRFRGSRMQRIARLLAQLAIPTTVAAMLINWEDPVMTALVTTDIGLFTRAIVVGSLGGVALLLGRRFSTRGAIMFPIYAGILFVTSLVIAQFPGLSFLARFSFVMLAMLVATVVAMAGVLYSVEQQLRRRAARGLPPVAGGAPWWSAPFVLASLAAASAGVAILIR
jgi:hypothetical protein